MARLRHAGQSGELLWALRMQELQKKADRASRTSRAPAPTFFQTGRLVRLGNAEILPRTRADIPVEPQMDTDEHR